MNYILPGTLSPPASLELQNIEIWLEQQIWGHRFQNDQTPWLLLLEALGIMSSRVRDRNVDEVFPGLAGQRHEDFEYGLMRREALRHLLFKDRDLDEIANSQVVSDGMWREWITRVGSEGEDRFGFLRERFTRFTAFRNTVALLRSSEIESDRKRRPSSRHLAPRGPEMLLADYGESRKGVPSGDRRFFRRGGELLYLMLNRSSHRQVLEPLVRRRLLNTESRWNLLAKALQPNEQSGPMPFKIGYLPLARHSSYDRLAKDWCSILSLSNLPDDNLPELLMRVSGLSIITYIVERGAEVLGIDIPPFPLDMISSATAGIKKISKDCYRRHRDMSRWAIEKVVDDVAQSQEWATARGLPRAKERIGKLVYGRFRYRTDLAIDRVPHHLKEVAISNHDNGLGRVVGMCADHIGLAVAKRGNGRWYAAGDGFLEALVLANVREPMEFERFLRELWRRYKIVVGTEVGRSAFETVNYGQLKANQRLLEERLRVLGFVKRLSDDCAFVTNPFWDNY
jgi:hypothetical protein